LPLFVASALRKWVPKAHQALIRIPQLSFYLWAIALTIVTGVTVQFVLESNNADYTIEIGLAIVALILCSLQFAAGWAIGRRYGDYVSSGQGLGQKNTILAIWMAQTFLHPLVAIAPAAYILWQNIINSVQIWRKNRGNGNL
jgi:BASS family bile acid:Na+ symporter